MQTIRVHQFNIQYNVARTLDSPAALQRRLDGIASALLARALEDQIEIMGSDELVCFIEQMEVNLTIAPTSQDDRQLATTWANTLHQDILKTLSQPDSSVIIFRNRGEFLASFLADLLRGRAWEYWYYQEFDYLRSHSLSQAIATVLLENGDTGRDALLELTRQGNLERLLTILSDPEVEAIASQCLLPPGTRVILPNTCPGWVESLCSLFNSGFTLTANLSRNVTRLYLGLLRQRPQLGPDTNLARFIRDLLQLRQKVMELSDRSYFLTQLESENWTTALSLLGRGSERQLLTTLMRELTGAEVTGLLRDLHVEGERSIVHRFITPFGGVFLLASAIADLELYDLLQNCPYPEPQGISKAGLLLWLIILQCLGRENAAQAQQDRGLALFAGLSQAPTTAFVQQYAESLIPQMHAAFTQNFQSHQQAIANRPGFFIYARSLTSVPPDPSDWFSLYTEINPILRDRGWDAALASVSTVVLQWFAAKLGAFADSSPSYLSRNFLESQAEIEVYSDRLTVHFLTCPLQMVLRMAGFDHNTWNIPWLENRSLAFKFE